MKKTNKHSDEPAKESTAAKRIAEMDKEERKNQKSLAEPERPVKNKGEMGRELQEKINKYQRSLQKEYRANIQKGAYLIRARTIQQTLIEWIIKQKATSKGQKFLQGLPIGKLQQYLPRFDWRDLQIVPPVRDQFETYACWAITATQLFESNLMLKRANFATNLERRREDVYWVDVIELNLNDTLDCVFPRTPGTSGRFEIAFNYYCTPGIPKSNIYIAPKPVVESPDLNILPEDKALLLNKWLKAEYKSLDGKVRPNHTARDAKLPKDHCTDQTIERQTALGWSYVRGRQEWKIPSTRNLKEALLEHGPLAVSMNYQGLLNYGNQKIDSSSTEVGHDRKAGVVFKRDNSGNLFVRFPEKNFRSVNNEPAFKDNTYQNLNIGFYERNMTPGPETRNIYELMGAAADCIKTGSHLRRTKTDRDVGTFYDRDTKTFIWHIPASNEVRIKTDPKTGNSYLSFPANTGAKLSRDFITGITTVTLPPITFEDLDPVFQADPEAKPNHDVLLIGWDDKKQAWIVQNSAGKNWGYNCYFARGEQSKLIGIERGYAYIGYGTLGKFAAWLEAPLVELPMIDVTVKTEPV